MKVKKFLFVSIAVLLIVSLLSFGAFAYYRSGTYEGSGKGKYGDVVLAVSVDNEKIVSIDVVSQRETPHFWKQASVLIDEIIEKNSSDVEAVTGATKSSNAIITAVNDALSQAELDSKELPGLLKTTISIILNIIPILFSVVKTIIK